MRNLKKETRGIKYDLHMATKRATFIAGGRKRCLLALEEKSRSWGNRGFVMANATIEFADGSQAYAIMEVSECDGGVICGMGVMLPDGIAWQNEPNFCYKLHKSKTQVFPYRYKIDANLRCNDHHVGPDGWSGRPHTAPTDAEPEYKTIGDEIVSLEQWRTQMGS